MQIFIPPKGNLAIPNFAVNENFLVDYDYLVEPEQKEEILRQRFTLRQRFDNGLALYYKQSRQDETISSNVTTVIPDETRSKTYGAEYIKGRLSLFASYNKVRSTFLPSTTKTIHGNYNLPIVNDMVASLHATGEWHDLGEPDNSNVEAFRYGASVSSRLTPRHTMRANIDVLSEDDSRFGRTEGLQFDVDLNYTYRQFYLTTGLEFDLLKREDDENESVFWYIRIRRLFR